MTNYMFVKITKNIFIIQSYFIQFLAEQRKGSSDPTNI